MQLSFIPNTLTLLNLFCGGVAIALTSQGYFSEAVYFIFIAAFLDFLDGLVARALKAASPLGQQLDSLADAVSFGLFPGYLLFQLISISLGVFDTPIPDRTGTALFLPFAGFLVAMFAALRLAIFNLSTDQSSSFKGIPTPAMTLVLAFIPLYLEHDVNGRLNLLYPHTGIQTSGDDYIFIARFLVNPYVLTALALILSLLMVSPFRFIALKIKKAGLKFYLPVLLLILPAIAIFLFFYYHGYYYLQFLLVMLWYVVLSLILNLIPNTYEVSRRS